MKKFFLLSLITVIPPSYLAAHPHIMINAYTHYYFDEQGMTGFYVQWIYDPVFSSQIIYECDRDENGTFSAEEIIQVEEYFFSRLEADDYFLELKIDGRKKPIPEPLNFSAEIDTEDQVVIFTFYIPIAEIFSGTKTRLVTEFTDPTNYTAFICPQRQLSLQGNAPDVFNIKINRMGLIAFSWR